MQRNYSLDVLKLICSFLVVMIHFPCESIERYIEPITRCAVPCFFCISGFLIYGMDMRRKLKRGIIKVFVLIAICTLMYGIKNVYFYDYFFVYFKVVPVFLLNDNPTAPHLWYLSAYFYILITFLIVKPDKLVTNRVLSGIIVFFLLVGTLLLGRYSFIISKQFPLTYSRNFIFTGIPFFILGMMLKHSIPTAVFENKKYVRMSAVSLLFLILVNLIESEVLLTKCKVGLGDLYFLTAPCVFSCMLLFLSYKMSNNLLAQLGRKYSLYIYVFHLGIGNVICKYIQSHPAWQFLNSFLLPIVVFLVTIVLIALIDSIIKYFLGLKCRL